MNGICQYCGADRSGPSAEAHSQDCPEEREAYASSRLAEVTAQLQALREKFKHYHVAKYVDEKLTDECGSCGFDLRNEIHIKREVHQKKILRVEHTFTNSAEWVILHLECGHTRSLRAAEYSHPNKTGTARCWDCQ
jgi:hypothetical protein